MLLLMVEMMEQIDHINIVVNDLPKMTAFYRDLLGLKVTKEVTISGRWVDEVVGLEGAIGDVIYLELQGGARIELIRYRQPAGANPANLGVSNTVGLRHIAFKVSEIDPLVAKLKGGGVEFLSDVQTVPDSQVSYTGGIRKRLVYFRDPEGNLLELCEYKAGP
jgi:catechol 2,3-dioxygenase-like lactoylglutathione lyase family enzyme